MNQHRIAVAENFNGSMKVEALHEKHSDVIVIKCTHGTNVTEATLPVAFIPVLKDLFDDLVDMKGHYRVI